MDAAESIAEVDATSDDPIATFLEEIALYGRSEKTIADYETTLRQFERFLRVSGGPTDLDDVTRRDCLSWIQHLRDEGYAPGSIRTKAVHLNRFYSHMAQVGAFDANPMVVVMEQLSERGDASPTRRDVSIEQMGTFVAEIDHPLRQAIVTMLSKTGIRAGELCNLDLRDVNLEHEAIIDYRDTPPRAAVRDHPDSFFVASDIAIGSVVNGEQRSEGNKRHRDTRIPIDEELQEALVRWLAIRPDPASDADPLFVSTSRKCGQRLTVDMVHSHVREAAEQRGWYAEGAGPEENVTPHYFRHFFTTRLRGRVDDAYLVQYIRGDVGDVMDRYTHDWEELVEKPYRSHIFRFSE
ncbi:tyrosine-type recombinase/integrase [Natrialbaceae archaeon A-CW1-1]